MTHPDWCGADHRCNLGEHRSDPWQAGMVGGTRIEKASGRGYLEMRVFLPLPADETAARDRARLAMWAVDLVLRVVLAGKLGPLREAFRQLTGTGVR